MMTYLLRNVPSDLWKAVKVRAAQRGETIREAIVRLLRVYAK
jgi:plasmid stability protein